MNESCGWSMSHIWMSHDMPHLYVKRGSNMRVTWPIYLWDMPHPHVKHGSYMCVTWLIHLRGMPYPRVKYDSLCVTWLIHMHDRTHSYVWKDAFICATWLIHMCDMTHTYVWHDSFICVTWLIHMCDITHPHTPTGWRKYKVCLTFKISLRKKSHYFQESFAENNL